MGKNFYKFVASCILILLLLLFLCRCGGDSSASSSDSKTAGIKTVIMVTDQAGLGDQGFNDSGWSGAERAAKEFGLTASFIESNEQADYIPNLSIAARKADVVIAMGFLMIDAVKAVAPKYPDKMFVFIDARVDAPNVASFDFKGEEASFFAGYLAAAITRTGKLGIVSGMDIPPVLAYEYGFRSGAELAKIHLKKDITLTRLTVGSFDDPVKGKSLALNLLGSGCDVVLQIAGNSGIGVIELFRKLKEPAYLISSDKDVEDAAPGKILTCVMKRFDAAVYLALKSAVKGRFKPGHYVLGFKEDAVGLTRMRHTQRSIGTEVLSDLEKLKKAVAAEKIRVPSSEKEFKAADFKEFAKAIFTK